MTDDSALAAEVLKLAKYIDQYMSRSMKVQDALGTTGVNMLKRCVKLAEETIVIGN